MATTVARIATENWSLQWAGASLERQYSILWPPTVQSAALRCTSPMSQAVLALVG